MPIGTGLAGYATTNPNYIQAVNTQLQAYCDGVTKIWCDTFTPIWDASGTTNVPSPGTGCAYLWALVDSLHPSNRGTKLMADAIWAAWSPKIAVHDRLPTAYNSASIVSFATHQRIVGPYTAAPGYTTATTGFNSTSCTGTRPTAPCAANAGVLSGTPTVVMSVLADPGDGFGQILQVVITATAASDKVYIVLDTATMTQLGAAYPDMIQFETLFSWTNYAASGCTFMQVTAQAGSGGTMNGSSLMLPNQSESATTIESDSGSKYAITGGVIVPAAFTGASGVVAQVYVNFSASAPSGQPLTLQFRRSAWDKVTATV